MRMNLQIPSIFLASALALGAGLSIGNSLGAEEPGAKAAADDNGLDAKADDEVLVPPGEAKRRAQAARVDKDVAAAIALPKGFRLTSEQAAAYEQLKNENEPRLRQAVEDLAQAKTRDERMQAAAALRDVRTEIRKAMRDIPTMPRRAKTGPASDNVASDDSAARGSGSSGNGYGTPYRGYDGASGGMGTGFGGSGYTGGGYGIYGPTPWGYQFNPPYGGGRGGAGGPQRDGPAGPMLFDMRGTIGGPPGYYPFCDGWYYDGNGHWRKGSQVITYPGPVIPNHGSPLQILRMPRERGSGRLADEVSGD
ncbi:MAG: hypothetical protein ABSA30_12190 [Candidatus Aminicenantales bacterium]